MIRNEICAYCGVRLTELHNAASKSSIEHMIPNTALSRANRRNKGDGDFMACTKCNQRKSKMDYIFGLIAKLQTKNVCIAEAAVSDILQRPNEYGRVSRMLNTAKFNGSEFNMTMPCSASDLDEYFTFLGKGQYFKEFRRPLNTTLYMVIFELVNKEMLMKFCDFYKQYHESDPLDDLAKNPNVEVLGDGECLIVPSGKRYLIFFQGSVGVKLDIVRKSNRNIKNKRSYLKSFATFQ